jgi:hypothetical protein
MSAVQREEREAAMLAFQGESGGVYRVYFFGAPDGVRLLADAVTGDRWSLGMLTAVNDCVRHVLDAPARQPCLCLTCPRPVRELPGLTFCVVLPQISEPHHALGSAVCPACAVLPNLGERAMIALRQMWPDLREISVMPGPETVQ